MTFNLNFVDLPKIRRKTVNGKRYYYNPETDEIIKYPSVTTVLGSDPEGKKALHEWRDRVGHKEANRVAVAAARRGSATHKMIENYIQGIDSWKEQKNPLYNMLFKHFKKAADDHLGEVLCMEGRLFSHHLKSSGTVDLVGNFEGKISVVDWKSSTRTKTKDEISNYFMQEAAYAVMFEEMTEIAVPNIVTVIATEADELLIYKDKRDNWIDDYKSLRENFK